ncbi:MAG: hypothetical protein ABR523_11995 [Desulfurivibrionaceae bacterium]
MPTAGRKALKGNNRRLAKRGTGGAAGLEMAGFFISRREEIKIGKNKGFWVLGDACILKYVPEAGRG